MNLLRKVGLIAILLLCSCSAIEAAKASTPHQIILMQGPMRYDTVDFEKEALEALRQKYPAAQILSYSNKNLPQNDPQLAQLMEKLRQKDTRPLDQIFLFNFLKEYGSRENLRTLTFIYIQDTSYIYNGSSDPMICARSLWTQYRITELTLDTQNPDDYIFRFLSTKDHLSIPTTPTKSPETEIISFI
jgi:hypothetical protein